MEDEPQSKRRLLQQKHTAAGIHAPLRVFHPSSSPRREDADRSYFQSYSHIGIHEQMIKDRVRTDAYRDAIMRHQNLISDKVVMDVGCGTGILSIFCAQAGARRVYAVEASEIAIQAEIVMRDNNLSDKVIILHGRVEDIEIEEKVDVIISEWMGYILLYESMLTSVIFARDKWLKPGGLILPSHATIYMAPFTYDEMYESTINFWRNVYGINMSAMIPHAKLCAFEEPAIETIGGENILTWPSEIKYLDCFTVAARDLESITTEYRFRSLVQAPLHGFAFWFDVEFNGPAVVPSESHSQLADGSSSFNLSNGSSHTKKRVKSDQVIVLSTSPEEAPTHWQQTLLYLYEPIEVKQDQIIEGSVTLAQCKENSRFMNIQLQYRFCTSSTGGQSFVKESVLR
ncbi:probable protein arginine N-methyltransferase 6 isoform X1 [Zingiber officinale]|uniref:probable protein arginine N-methyltransferase 6 isoform X1 n=1 Tax=Zingiber officinale TaxID=94328 RepID=UPI001C4ADDCD|nr:probable protein arginine N-methyltransferase 6 isoform X1 [Zingiber officinale]XP_042447079.1 probable protein arginine N-methyltransferase 6 isoform X1 [Zingiber officinale]